MGRLWRWIETRLWPRHAARREARREAVQKRLSDWRYARTNDKDVIDRDADRAALSEADKLWRSDPEAALPQLQALAERGSVWGMHLLGYAFERGIGTAPDPSLAEGWYRRAADGGCQQALLRLGRIYELRGEFAASMKVYEVGKAAHLGPAMYRLAWIKLRQSRTPEQFEDARSLFEQAAAQGDLGAQMDFSHLLTRGRFGWRRMLPGLRLAWDGAIKIVAIENETEAAAQVGDVPPAPMVDADLEQKTECVKSRKSRGQASKNVTD